MRRHGGVHSWAARLGYHYEPRVSTKSGPRRLPPRKFPPEQIEKVLKEMCGELGKFPTVAEIRKAHGDSFYNAMRDFGGTEVWARTCGFVPRRPGRPKGATSKNISWTDERIRAELAVFLHGRTTWPRLREFRDADLERLHTACLRHGGLPRWAREFDLPAPAERPDRRTPEHEVKQRLMTFLSQRSVASWPGINEFRQAGEYGLLKQVYLHGGHARWAKELGYPDPTGRTSTRGYDHTRVYMELSLLVDKLGLQTRMPTEEEFSAHKAKRLANAIDRLGGPDAWAQMLGLTSRWLVAA